MMTETMAVTGAFGYSGKYIATRLLDAGYQVTTLTDTKGPDPFGGRVKRHPLAFNDEAQLIDALDGVSVLFNTYWVRFNHRNFTHATAVENSLKLFAAARKAGVRRVVHISITNPAEDSSLEYFSGKALLEKALRESGVSYAVLRPTVLFGKEDILINNIAWMLRKFPVFGVFGDGDYPIQPIFVDDLACLAVEQSGKRENTIINAVGPEIYSYRSLVSEIGSAIGKTRPIISIPPSFGYWMGKMVGHLVHDVVVTKEEIEGLMTGLLCVDSEPTGKTLLSQWARENHASLGMRYASELRRRR